MAEQNPRTGGRGWFWPALVVCLLAFQLLVGGALFYFAHNDPSFVVEKDYYRKGIEWDKQLAQRRLDKELGWNLVLEVDGPVESDARDAMRTIRVRLNDRDGRAIEGARVGLVCFHRARASDRIELDLAEVEPGVYEQLGPLRKEGLWVFESTIHHGDKVFTHRLEQWVAGDGGE